MPGNEAILASVAAIPIEEHPHPPPALPLPISKTDENCLLDQNGHAVMAIQTAYTVLENRLKRLGDSLAVEFSALTRVTLVRIQVPQPAPLSS